MSRSVEVRLELPEDTPAHVRGMCEQSLAAGRRSVSDFHAMALRYPQATGPEIELACTMFARGIATSMLEHLDPRSSHELLVGVADAYSALVKLEAAAQVGGAKVESEAMDGLGVSKVPLDERGGE